MPAVEHSSTLLYTALGDGGGIFNQGRLTLTNSTVSDNTSTSAGGGIYNSSLGTLTLTNSTVSGNGALSGKGGGISNEGRLTLTNSTVSYNYSQYGGGIFIKSYSTDNIARADLTFSTIYGNRAPVGADIAIQPSQVTISNSIVADHASAGPDISGTLISSGYNLFQDNSGASFDPSTAALHRTDKLLSANDLSRLFASPVGLRKNGGPTETYALTPNGPAVDAIPLANCHVKVNGITITTDQRGFPRPDGKEGTCDIGAFEHQD
jgi:hypothetical protein